MVVIIYVYFIYPWLIESFYKIPFIIFVINVEWTSFDQRINPGILFPESINLTLKAKVGFILILYRTRDSCSRQIFKRFRGQIVRKWKEPVLYRTRDATSLMLTILWCIAYRRLAVNRIWLWYCATTKLFVQKKKFNFSIVIELRNKRIVNLFNESFNTGFTTIGGTYHVINFEFRRKKKSFHLNFPSSLSFFFSFHFWLRNFVVGTL